MPFSTTIDCITRAESTLGILLPDGYREYLLGTNGGELSLGSEDWQIFPVCDDSDRKRASRSASHIVRETEFAVASNGEGDYLLFLPDAKDSSSLNPGVYRWDHELRKLVIVSEDFETLWRASQRD